MSQVGDVFKYFVLANYFPTDYRLESAATLAAVR